MPKRINYQRTLCRLLYQGVHDPITGINSSSTGTTIIDTTGSLNYSSGDVNAFDRKYVTVMTASDAALRGVTRVIEGGWIVTGTLTVDPAVGSLASGDIFIISDHPPAVLAENINLVITNMYEETLWPLSLHVMGNNANDMEPSTIATDYTAENSGTLATEATIVFNGAQSLKVTAGAALSGATSGAIAVFEGKPYYAAVTCSVKQGDDADFRIVNVQDSDAQIDDNATTDEPSFSELVIPFTPPSGCEQAEAFFLGTASGDIAYWEDFQIWQAGTGVYPLPSWVTRPEQVIDVRSYPRGTSGPGDFGWRSNERRSRPLSWGFERGDRRADVPVRIWVENPGSSRPFVVLKRALSELTTDILTSPADEDNVVFWAAKLTLAEPLERASIIKELKSQFFMRVTTKLPDRISLGG